MKKIMLKYFKINLDDAIQRKTAKRMLLPFAVILIISLSVCGTAFYSFGHINGFKYQPQVSSDGSPYVCITPTGKRYHMHWCNSMQNTSINLSIAEAKDKGYTPCKKCRPDRLLK